MLSISNVKEINRQIADELRKVDSIIYSHDEKMEAIERINALKALLSDRYEPKVEQTIPRPQTIVAMLRARR